MKLFIALITGLLVILTNVTPVLAPVQAAEISGDSGKLSVELQENTVDERVVKLKMYLEELKSPLAPYAQTFVTEADTYELGDNWSLVAAIAGVESTFGKHIPRESYNAWGWGIPTGAKSGIGFDNWDHGIEIVTKGLKEKYIDRGADTPEKMSRIYAPPSKTWAGNVRFFMKKIEDVTVPPKLSI
ncbi:hypothetical protein HY468_05865 [Candidatus Roizmanbacteria bacterium]|nr:hypothetical protein [Candidatus Roizmanbacteria bacterium]